jgi:hypothetical protein
MSESKKHRAERLARKEAALEASNERRWTLVQRGRFFGLFDNDYGSVELISEDRSTAKRALAARLKGEA